MAVSRRCLQRPFNTICLALVLVAALQVYLDIRRTELLMTQYRRDVDDDDRRQLDDATPPAATGGGDLSNNDAATGVGGGGGGSRAIDDVTPNRRRLSMADYLRSYTLPARGGHRACSNVTRPDVKSLYKYKDVYQHFRLTPRGYNVTDAYFLAFYYDDRFVYTGAKYIRTFVTIKGIGPERQAAKELIQKTAKWSWSVNATPTSVLLWYDGFQHPVSATCSTAPAFGITRNVSGQFYYEYIITCALPEIDLLPAHVSLAQHACAAPVRNYVALTYPRPPAASGGVAHRDIGVCVASLYGSMNATDVPYLVSWMEALSVYGVIEVNLNNALMKLDASVQRVLDYYVTRGRLLLTHYPVIHATWTASEQDQATESTNRMHVGDCFFRNIKRYWHTLVIDLDELPVPMRVRSYADALDAASARNASLADAHCHTMRSAFFYFDFAPGNPEYPRHLPLHRYTRRFKTEPVVFGHNDGLGLGKSFHNSRRVVAMGHHLCRSSHRELGVHLLKQSFIDETHLLIHHYRRSCKYTVDCQSDDDDGGAGGGNRTVVDSHIPHSIGAELRRRVEQVLQQLNYPTTMTS